MPVVKLLTARVVTATSVVRVDCTSVVRLPSERKISITTLIATFADMLFSEDQRLAVIVPEIVTSAERGSLMNWVGTGVAVATSTPLVGPATVLVVRTVRAAPAVV